MNARTDGKKRERFGELHLEAGYECSTSHASITLFPPRIGTGH